ncbi:MAG: hypothetical protein OXI01_06720 [Albidovulum sp.]|nr:hypothetical protein [Albidovulum sp.]
MPLHERIADSAPYAMWAGFIGGIILLVFKGGGWFSAVNKDGDYIEEFKSSIEKKSRVSNRSLREGLIK